MSDVVVADAPERHRFEITVDGVLAGFTRYLDKGDERIFPHTEVKDEYAGQGLATQLIRAALDQTPHDRTAGHPALPGREAVHREEPRLCRPGGVYFLTARQSVLARTT